MTIADDWAADPRMVLSRHTLTPKIIAGAITGVCLGTSITEGTGTSGPTKVFSFQLCQKLNSFPGHTNAIANRGVGGSNILAMLMYVSDLVDMGPTGNAAPLGLKSSVAPELTRTMLIFEGPRNDVGNTDPAQYKELLDLLVRQAIKKGVTPLFRTSVPQLNWTGVATDPVLGIRDNDPAFQPTWPYSMYYEAILEVCQKRGVSLIDHWKRGMKLYADGFDMRKFMHDATHPNDAGNADAADLAELCLIRGQDEVPGDWSDGETVLYPDMISNYYPFSSSAVKGAISGVTTPGTARNDQLAEGGNFGYAFAAGNAQKFHAPVPLVGLILPFCDGTPNDGGVTAKLGANNLNGGTALVTAGSIIREAPQAILIDPSDPLYGTAGDVSFTQNSGTPLLFGVGFLCAQQTACDDTPDSEWNDAGWTIGAFNGAGSSLVNDPCWECQTVGNQIYFGFTGRYVGFYYTKGPSRGKFSYAVDGGDAVMVDSYINAAVNQAFLLIDLGSECEHQVAFAVQNKNAASTSALVELGSFRSFTMIPGHVRTSVPEGGITVDQRQIFQ